MSPARKIARSRSHETTDNIHRAEAANRPFTELRFGSIRKALAWYFERAETLTSPQGMHPRTYKDKTGAQVLISVDGGKGGDFDDVLATMSTIGAALGHLLAHDRHGYNILMLIYRDGLPQKAVADRYSTNQGTVSRWKATAETFLAGALAADVLQPRSR